MFAMMKLSGNFGTHWTQSSSPFLESGSPGMKYREGAALESVKYKNLPREPINWAIITVINETCPPFSRR